MGLDISIADVSNRPSIDRLLDCFAKNGVAVLEDALEPEAVHETLAGVKKLFCLPRREKLRLRSPCPLAPGFIPFGCQTARDTGAIAMLESWDLRPDDPTGFPITLLDVWRNASELHKLLFERVSQLLTVLESELNLPEDRLGGLLSQRSCSMHLLHYPARVIGTVDNGRRQSVHKDASLLTLLPKASGAGFLVEFDDGWAPLEIAGGDVVVMVGYALEYVTAGRLQACRHAVVTPEDPEDAEDRFATPFFASLQPNARLDPIDPSTIETYPPISRDEFLRRHFPTVFDRKDQEPF